MKFVFYDGGSFLSKFSVILLNTCQFSKNRVLLAGFCRRLRGVAGKHWSFGIRLCSPVIPKLTNLSSSWDGKLFWEAIDAIGHYSTYGNGPLFLGICLN